MITSLNSCSCLWTRVEKIQRLPTWFCPEEIGHWLPCLPQRRSRLHPTIPDWFEHTPWPSPGHPTFWRTHPTRSWLQEVKMLDQPLKGCNCTIEKIEKCAPTINCAIAVLLASTHNQLCNCCACWSPLCRALFQPFWASLHFSFDFWPRAFLGIPFPASSFLDQSPFSDFLQNWRLPINIVVNIILLSGIIHPQGLATRAYRYPLKNSRPSTSTRVSHFISPLSPALKSVQRWREGKWALNRSKARRARMPSRRRKLYDFLSPL